MKFSICLTSIFFFPCAQESRVKKSCQLVRQLEFDEAQDSPYTPVPAKQLLGVERSSAVTEGKAVFFVTVEENRISYQIFLWASSDPYCPSGIAALGNNF